MVVLGLRELRRLLSRSTYNCTAAAPFFGSRILCTAAKEEEGCNEEGVLSKRSLMQEEGFTEPQIEAVLDAHPRSDKLALLLTILKDRGITGPTAGDLVSSHSQLLRCNLNQFCSRLQALEDAGISPTLLKKAIFQRWGYLSTSTSLVALQKHLSFLQDLGLSPHDSFTTMLRCPSFLRLSLEKRLKPRCELLCKMGVSKHALGKLIREHPCVFTCSEDGFFQKLHIIEEFGLDMKTEKGARSLGLWSQYSIEKLYAKFAFLKTLGISHEEATLMVHKLPCVLCIHEEKLKRKIDFFRNTMKFSLEYMLCSSALFTCSLEKRVIPRWAILQDLSEKGLLKKRVSLLSAVVLSNKTFANKYKVDPG